jgi:hypothetical protein
MGPPTSMVDLDRAGGGLRPGVVEGPAVAVPLQRYGPAAELKAITDTRTALLAGLIGVGALLTFWLNSKAQKVTERGQITERFNNAIDHLGSDKLDVRLGGIYALERIAKDSYDDRETIAEVLTAFVRRRAPWLPSSQPGRSGADLPSGEQPSLPLLRVRAGDVQAAMTVLGRGSFPRRPDQRLEVGQVDLRRAYLNGADLHATRFVRANLEGTYLSDANLHDAWLFEARLKDAQLIGANLQDANLRGAQLQDAKLLRAHLEGANFTNANLRGTVAEGAVADERTKWPHGCDPASIGVEVRK